MITFVFLNGTGNPEAIGKAASKLSVKCSQLRNMLTVWCNTQYQDGFVYTLGKHTYTFSQADEFSIGTVTKHNKNGKRIITLNFSMELTLS